jgi:hypothetical protein
MIFSRVTANDCVKESNFITVTKNEILTALNKPEEHILAIVKVDGTNTHAIYLKAPFRERPDFAATSVNYGLTELVANSEVIFERDDDLNDNNKS